MKDRLTYRVLLLIPHLTGGGAERQCLLLASGLTAIGWEVHLGYWCGEVGNISPDLSKGIIFHCLGTRLTCDPRMPYRIACLIRRHRPHVVHTWLRQMDIFGGLAALVCRTPWVIAERCRADAYGSVQDRLRRFIGRFADVVIANSAAGIDYWSQSGHSPRQQVIPNGLPVETIARASALDEAPLECPLIITVGRLASQKRPLELISALASGLRDNRFHLAVIGDGPLSGDARQLVIELGISSQVTMTGFVPTEVVWTWLHRAQGFVFLSDYEGQPNVVMEAMAAGCPAVVSDIPEHRELLAEDMALFVDQSDVAAIAAGVDQILAEPEQARQRAEAAQRHIRSWSVEAMLSAYDGAYLSLIKRRA